jgi:hypothetical protein
VSNCYRCSAEFYKYKKWLLISHCKPHPCLYDLIEDWTTEFLYIWTVLKFTLHITRTIKVSCLSRFLLLLLHPRQLRYGR